MVEAHNSSMTHVLVMLLICDKREHFFPFLSIIAALPLIRISFYRKVHWGVGKLYALITLYSKLISEESKIKSSCSRRIFSDQTVD